MTKDCKGVLGALLGHNIRSFIVERIPQEPQPFTLRNYFGTLEDVFDAFAHKKYEVRCARCGKTPQQIAKRGAR